MDEATFEHDRVMSGGRSSCSEVDKFVFGHGREVAVIAEGDQGLAHGRIDETVGEAGRCQSHSYHLGEAVADEKEATAPGMQPGDLSESARNRLACMSRRCSSPLTASVAASRASAGHTTMRTLVPSAVYLRGGDPLVVDGLATRNSSLTDGSGHHESFQVDPVVTVPVRVVLPCPVLVTELPGTTCEPLETATGPETTGARPLVAVG